MKGLYKKARNGLIKGFTGIDSAYEAPVNPSLELDTSKLSVPECVEQMMELLNRNDVIPAQALQSVKELFVPVEHKEQLKSEAELMQRVDLTKLDMQWLQVNVNAYTSSN